MGVKTSLKDDKINLRGHDMIHGTGNKKNIGLFFVFVFFDSVVLPFFRLLTTI